MGFVDFVLGDVADRAADTDGQEVVLAAEEGLDRGASGRRNRSASGLFNRSRRERRASVQMSGWTVAYDDDLAEGDVQIVGVVETVAAGFIDDHTRISLGVNDESCDGLLVARKHADVLDLFSRMCQRQDGGKEKCGNCGHWINYSNSLSEIHGQADYTFV